MLAISLTAKCQVTKLKKKKTEKNEDVTMIQSPQLNTGVPAVSSSWQTWILVVPAFFLIILTNFPLFKCDSLDLLPAVCKVVTYPNNLYLCTVWTYDLRNCSSVEIAPDTFPVSVNLYFSFLHLHWALCSEYWSVQWVLSNRLYINAQSWSLTRS